MNVFSIDQSIRCTAWCFFKDGELDDYGTIKTQKQDRCCDLYERCHLISSALYTTHNGKVWNYGEEDPIVLVREGLGYGGSNSNATRDLAYLLGHIEKLMGPMYEVAPTALKKFATGSGKAKKEDMIDALPKEVRERFEAEGYKKTTGLADLADAYFIGRWFIEKD